MPAIGSLGIQLITPHLYLFDPRGILPSATSAELRQLGLTVIYLSDTSGAHSRGTMAEMKGGAGALLLLLLFFAPPFSKDVMRKPQRRK